MIEEIVTSNVSIYSEQKILMSLRKLEDEFHSSGAIDGGPNIMFYCLILFLCNFHIFWS